MIYIFFTVLAWIGLGSTVFFQAVLMLNRLLQTPVDKILLEPSKLLLLWRFYLIGIISLAWLIAYYYQ